MSILKFQLLRKLPVKVTRMIGLTQNEDVLFYLRLFPFRSVAKNGKRQIRTFFIITSSNVIFLDYFFFRKELREKDVIPIKDITSIEEKMKKQYVAEEPILEITTSSKEIYEIIFKKAFDRYKKYCSEITEIIKSQAGTE